MNLTVEQAATLAWLRELGEKEGPDSLAQKEYDETISLLTSALMREMLATGEIKLDIVEEKDVDLLREANV
jgi:hypothetical protein